jgi:glycosyltransferase involved in cell wall biosynthesis
MSNPKVTVLMITCRPDEAYLEHPEWHVLGKVVEDLNKQTFKDFELVVVDGVFRPGAPLEKAEFCYRRIQPKENLWTRNKKTCISNYRNTGLAAARGELVLNIDDCAYLPPIYVELFWRAWNEHKVCLSATWPHNGDQRIPRNDILNPKVAYIHQKTACGRGQVFGFGSYPLEMALELNGYDEAYDGGMYLEDIDWGCRLADYGLRMHFAYIPGFRLHPQSKHHPDVVDPDHPYVKCCNAAWQTQQVWRTVSKANTPELWNKNTEALKRLLGPCYYMKEINGKPMCLHWQGKAVCEYTKEQYLVDGKSFALERDELADQIFDHPPVRDLKEERT